MIHLKIITSTTREGSQGITVARWITKLAKDNSNFDVELLDLSEIDLPLMKEPNHPKLQKYQYESTKNWSQKIEDADAFVIVLGEYNYGFPAPIKNALDHLFNEWKYKPVAIVSYGGISAGLRSSQMLKQVVTTLGMMPLPEQVSLPFFANQIDENQMFLPNEIQITSAELMFSELLKWSRALKTLRGKTTNNGKT